MLKLKSSLWACGKLCRRQKCNQMFFIWGQICDFCSLFLKIWHFLKRTNPANRAGVVPTTNIGIITTRAALLAGFVLFKTCKFFRNKEQKWQFFPQIKNIWLHFSLWHSLPQAHKLLLNLSISSWVWVVRSYNLNSPYKSSENVREVEFVGQQYKLYQLH